MPWSGCPVVFDHRSDSIVREAFPSRIDSVIPVRPSPPLRGSRPRRSAPLRPPLDMAAALGRLLRAAVSEGPPAGLPARPRRRPDPPCPRRCPWLPPPGGERRHSPRPAPAAPSASVSAGGRPGKAPRERPRARPAALRSPLRRLLAVRRGGDPARSGLQGNGRRGRRVQGAEPR